VVLVAAAGNEGTTSRFYPAAYPEVIAVAASDSSDRLYSWSNRGSWVAVAAPGCNSAPRAGGGYGDFCGTSSATPLVSGLAALALSAKVGARRAEVEQAITTSALAISGSVQHGRVEARATLAALGQASPAAPTSSTRKSARFRGKLTSRSPSRTYRRSVASGRLTAKLSFTGSRKLRLALVNEKGKTVRRVSGRGPLRLGRKVRAGTFRFVVTGRDTRAKFTLAVSYRAR
jgi:subtilisin family serine protease